VVEGEKMKKITNYKIQVTMSKIKNKKINPQMWYRSLQSKVFAGGSNQWVSGSVNQWGRR
jgi:hypothetical protein